MHARELLELAALAALHGPAIAGSSQRLSESSIERSWTASKCRLDRWGHALKQHAERSAASAFALRARPRVFAPS